MKYLHYKPISNSSLHKVKRQKFCKNNMLCCNAKGTREVIETEDMRLDLSLYHCEFLSFVREK